MNIIETISHKTVDFNNLEESEIDLHDIASGLSKLCRFAGQIPCHYSVAEHSVILSELMLLSGYNKETCMYALLHDATEAYMGDVTAPVKRLCPDFTRLEEKLMLIISNRLIPVNGSTVINLSAVDHFDKVVMLNMELDHFRGGKKSPLIHCLNSNVAYISFIDHWNKLRHKV